MKQIQLFLLLCLCAGNALSQSATEFTHTIDFKTATGTVPAKDFWIAIPQIYNTGDSGKYAEVYIASQKATTIHIRGSKFAPVDRKLKAGEQFIFKIETQDTGKTMETTGSAVVQNKGIHVWSDGVDLSVYVYIHNAAFAGGTLVLPITSWGLEYVVSGYESEYFHGYQPGEITLVAAEDSTVVTITPSTDIRHNNGPTLYPAGQPFSITVNRGQTIQYIHRSTSEVPMDFTGTVVTSNKPIGVISAVMCVSIPQSSIGFDFICEMMLPVCAWGKTYRTTGLHHANSGEQQYRIIASKDFQSIYTNGGDERVVDKYKSSLVDIYGSVLWQSDAPFMLVSYIGDAPNWQTQHPAMVCISPGENYQKEILFQIPADTTKNWVDIAFDTAARLTTTIDGVPIAGFVSGKMKNYQINSVATSSGAHILKSSAPVDLYAYGSTAINTYAWGGMPNPPCVANSDTLPPTVTTNGDCNSATITFYDIHPNASKIFAFAIDSLENLKYTPSPAFVQGTPSDSFFYRLDLVDVSKPGKAMVVIFDAAGNCTKVTSRIDARPNPKVTPAAIQIPYAGAVSNYRSFELTNTTILPMTLTGPNGLRLSNGNAGFAFVAPDLSVLPVATKRSFLVSYTSPSDVVHRDTILLGDECTFVHLPLESINIGEILGTTGVDLGCLAIGTSREDVMLVDNFGLYELTVLSVTFDDAAHFTSVAPVLPYIIPPEKRVGITVRYTPDAADTNCTTARIMTKEVDELTATVCGCGLTSGSVRTDASENRSELLKALNSGRAFAWLTPVPNPVDRNANVKFTFGLAKAAVLTLDLFNLEGKRVATSGAGVYSAGMHEESLSITDLPPGSYLYRYSTDGATYGGMLTIR